ncbi:MAG: S41 family peptidase, partial [Chloroflexota bacterium]
PHKRKLELPVVVLVDEFSASGSEVLAGALRDRGVAKLVGVKTFGKGSVNIFRPLPDGGALYITTSRWQTPNGTTIEGQGLEPDIPSDLHGDDLVDWAIDYLHQQATGRASFEPALAGA